MAYALLTHALFACPTQLELQCTECTVYACICHHHVTQCTHCERHLCNAIEKHLEGAEEEEARIQVSIVDAVGRNVSAQEQRGADDGCEGCLYADLKFCWRQMHL